jgi:hypothetical protein
MLVAKAKLLNVSELPAKGDYPPSCLVSIYDEASSDTLTLIVTDADTAEKLKGVKQFSEVALQLRWRSLNLASLGGTGRGKAYRLQVVGLAGSSDAVA